MSGTNPPDGDFIPVTRARKPVPTEKAGKVSDARILSIENTQTTLLQRFDDIDKANTARFNLILNRLPATLNDDLKAMPVDIRTVTEDLQLETESRDNLKTFIKNEIDSVRYDMETKNEATEALIEAKHQASITLISTASTASTASTTRASSVSVFPRFSASYGGTRSAVPDTLTPAKYYQDVIPADQDLRDSVIDPTTPMLSPPLGGQNHKVHDLISADVELEDVIPADQDLHCSFIDPTTPMLSPHLGGQNHKVHDLTSADAELRALLMATKQTIAFRNFTAQLAYTKPVARPLLKRRYDVMRRPRFKNPSPAESTEDDSPL
jgi:hypothetical protein